ncbi:hypothetical protein DMN77_05955 [Paenibacillus sp. 79R4]|uniref:hypothetical protein n=1 Tax=Paenibacillus sp. 79R4 TaxID=2212847 RepID=UPI0015C02B53|nr:hypothetical protein [Paenibacillus sp. 79R4]NWL87144.1 hypothetical protein [Paenibacillus sp. 79R4]
MLKKLFLLLWSSMIAIICFWTFVGMFFWNSNRKVALFWLAVTVAIFLFYVATLIILKRRYSGSFLFLNVLLCIILFVSGPQIQQLGIHIKHYFEIPSSQVQKQLNQEVTDAIEKTKIPYKVNFEISKKMTSQKGSGVVAVVKTKKGEVQKTEIDKIISETFNRDMFISFYDYDEKWVISIKFNIFREIEYCYPFSKCEDLGINLKQ